MGYVFNLWPEDWLSSICPTEPHPPSYHTVIWLCVCDTEKAGSAQLLCQKARKEGPLLDSSSHSNGDQMGQAELSRPFPVCATFAHSWNNSWSLILFKLCSLWNIKASNMFMNKKSVTKLAKVYELKQVPLIIHTLFVLTAVTMQILFSCL